MNKQIIPIVSRKQIHKYDPSLSDSWSQHPLTCTQRLERGFQKMTNNKDFMDFTIYRG